MRRALLLAAFTACKFQAGGAAIDAGRDARVDARRDAPASAPCSLGAADRTGVDRGKVGLSTGGGSTMMFACDQGDLVGIALDMSTGGVNGTTIPSAHGIRIGCADVTVDGAGGHTGAVTTKDLEGSGGAGFTPSAMTPLAQCEDGAVVSGLSVYGSMYTSFFLDATMSCSTFNTAGQLIAVSLHPITGSGTDTNNPSTVQCSAGEQVVQATTDTGAGLDSVHLWCSPTTCN